MAAIANATAVNIPDMTRANFTLQIAISRVDFLRSGLPARLSFALSFASMPYGGMGARGKQCRAIKGGAEYADSLAYGGVL